MSAYTIRSIVAEYRSINGVGIPIEELIRLAGERGVEPDEAEELIEGMRMRADLYMVKGGIIYPTKKSAHIGGGEG